MPYVKCKAIHTGMKQRLQYILDPDKTDGLFYCNSHNCLTNAEDAYLNMKFIYENFTHHKFEEPVPEKGNARVKLLHYVQSFSPDDNVPPEYAHRIGISWIQRAFGDNVQAVIATHVDKAHIHNHDNEEKFIQRAMEKSNKDHLSDLKKAKKTLADNEKRISELDRLFKRLYEDNVAGRISDTRFGQMSTDYETEQEQLRKQSAELAVFISDNEQKTCDVATFVELVRKYEVVTELTPELMNELIDRIEVHAPDKSSGHRRQTIDIYFRFNVASASAEICNMDYCKKKKAV